MKRPLAALMGTALIALVHAQPAWGVEVTIDPARYTGQWSVDYGPLRKGPAVVDLGAADQTTGAHVVSLGGAELFFDVAGDGTVVSRTPAAATGGPGRLTLNTTLVHVLPRSFKGRWRVTDGATPDLVGTQFVTLVPGLDFYSLEVGANGGFVFHLAADGSVSVPNGDAATGGHGLLALKDTERFDRQRLLLGKPARESAVQPIDSPTALQPMDTIGTQ